MEAVEKFVEQQTGELYGDLWHQYDDQLFKQSVELFEKRWLVNGEPKDFFQGKHCLDAGCGGGRYSIAMALMGAASVAGMDVSTSGLEDAQRRVSELGLSQITFQQGSVLDMPFTDEEFDFVLCSGILHHTLGVERGLAELHRVVKRGGSVFLLLYGAGGLYWPLNLVMRPLAELLGKAEVERCIEKAKLPANKRRAILDSLFCPILETYSPERIEFLLREAGFKNWRYWTRGRFDHESDCETLARELEIYVALWQTGATSAPTPEFSNLETNLADICWQVTVAARDLIEERQSSWLTREELHHAVIGDGHYRIIAERP